MATLQGRAQIVPDPLLQFQNESLSKGGLVFYLDGAHSPESLETCATWFSHAVKEDSQQSGSFREQTARNDYQQSDSLEEQAARKAFSCQPFFKILLLDYLVLKFGELVADTSFQLHVSERSTAASSTFDKHLCPQWYGPLGNITFLELL